MEKMKKYEHNKVVLYIFIWFLQMETLKKINKQSKDRKWKKYTGKLFEN